MRPARRGPLPTLRLCLSLWPALGCALACAPEPTPAGRPNVVLISVDTLRADHLGCYGYPRPVSPRMDALAAGGTLFSDVTAPSPWTLPSHATLLTGRYPMHHGVKGHEQRLSEDQPLLTRALADAGYRTLAVVNSHNLTPRFGLHRAFEEFSYINEWDDPDGPERRIVNRGEEILATARGWLEEPTKGPFFLFLHFYDVHSGYDPRPEYREGLVRPYGGELRGETLELSLLRRRGAALSPEDVRHLVDLYDAEIRQMDALLGDFFDFLAERGLDRDTLVVITSDHGEEFMEHGSLLHGRTHYQEVLAVPLILRGPGVPAGVRVSEPASLADVAPTVLAAVGLPAPAGLDGIDLARAWRGEPPPSPPRVIFAEADHGRPEGEDLLRSARRGSHKLIRDDATGTSEFYNLARDPGERLDLTHGARRIRSALAEAIAEHEATGRKAERAAPLSPEEEQRLRDLGYLQ